MRISFLPIVLVVSALVAGDSAPLRAQNLAFERVLAGRTLDIAQDQDGYLWIATANGLVKYDGYESTVYRRIEGDSTSISDNRVEVVLVDSKGTVWAGVLDRGGLNRYNPASDTFTRFMADPDDPASLIHNNVFALLEDHEGTLWIGTQGGLDRFDPETARFTHFRHDPTDPTSLSHNQVRVLYEDRKGSLWVGTGNPWTDTPADGGLNRFDPKTGTFIRFMPDPDDPERLVDGRVRALLEDSRGDFWVGTWGDGLHKMDREAGTFTRYRYDPQNPNTLSRPHLRHGERQFAGLSFLHEDRSGKLWIGALQGGINRFDPETGALTHVEALVDSPRGLADNHVWTIHESRDGTIWIGTFGGLYKQVSESVAIPSVELPGDNGHISAIWMDRSGLLWLGTGVGGLYSYERRSGRFTNFRHDPEDATSLCDDDVIAIYEDRQRRLWIGTHGGGLCQLDRRTNAFIQFRHDPNDPSSLSSDIVSAIFQDGAGRLWIGTVDGLNLYHPSTGTFTRYRPHGSSLRVAYIHEDSAGRLWVGQFEDVSLVDVESRRFTPYWPQVATDILQLLGEDDEGRLWFRTSEGVLYEKITSGEAKLFTPSNSGLPTPNIHAAFFDHRGYLWGISAYYPGMVRLNPEDGTVQTFEDRRSRPIWNVSPRRLFKSESGEFFIAGQNEFYAFFPEDIERRANPYPPQLTLELRARGDDSQLPAPSPAMNRDGGHAVTLSHDENEFSFKYAALHFADPSENQYMYMLEGYDAGWRGPTKQRTADYFRVPPGEYTFRIKASNSDGVWNEEGASMAVVVLPPWWQTWWAYAVYVIGAIGILGAAARVQRRYVVRKERETARERELEHAREIGAMNKQLRSHEKQLEAQNERLRELDAQKSRFFANISHEFRTPLTLILGPLRDALHGEGEAGHLEHHIPMMHRNAQRLLGLINQLLDLSNLEAGAMQLKPRRLDLVEFLREIALSFSARAEREGIALSFSPDSASMPAMFDPDKLEKVVANLLSNAFKFTPSGGKIRVGLTAGGDRLAITVKDTGRGIPEEELPRIFDRFYQVDGSVVREQEGTGIGLALTKELVELHGGSVTVDSEAGFGTTFTVQLPVGDEDGEPLETQKWKAARLDVGAVRPEVEDSVPVVEPAPDTAPSILIVDDNPDMRAFLRSLLTGRYRVSEAKNGEIGLAMAAKERPDLVLADVMMPKKDGYTLCRELKSDPDLGHIPVVLLTAKADLESKLVGLETGADDYLAKPFSPEEVLTRMENLIQLRRRLRDRYSGEIRLGPSEIDVPSEEAAFLARVRDEIESNMSESRFGVSELADAVGLSSRQLQRRLREAADLSAGAYIRMMRLERAAQLLEQDAGLVSEIAYEVGFKNSDHFSRLFRQVFGVPPSEYCVDAEQQ